MKDVTITKALEAEKKFLSDKQARYIYDLREKSKRDLFSSIATAEERGEKRGIEKTALSLLQLNVDPDVIKKATGLSKEELAKVKTKYSL